MHKIKVQLQLDNGMFRHIEVQVEGSTTVRQLREYVAEVLNIPLKELQLQFKGKYLEDETPSKQAYRLGLQQGSVIYATRKPKSSKHS